MQMERFERRESVITKLHGSRRRWSAVRGSRHCTIGIIVVDTRPIYQSRGDCPTKGVKLPQLVQVGRFQIVQIPHSVYVPKVLVAFPAHQQQVIFRLGVLRGEGVEK